MRDPAAHPIRGPNRGDRRGSIYLVTLMTSLIVSAMAVAALSTVRVQRRQASDAESLRQAQLNAASALQLARYYLRTDAAVRTKLNSGTWATDKPLGTGSYSFTGSDPIDGNLLGGDLDPILITAVGKHGGSTYSLVSRFEFTQPGISCLQSAAHSQLDLTITGATLTSLDVPISSNSNLIIGPASAVTANCEASGTVTKDVSASLTGSMTSGVPARQMPDFLQVLNYYQPLGTAIPYANLPQWRREYLQNPGAESGTTAPWVASNCSVSLSSTIRRSGTRSFYVSNRTVLLDGVKQNLAAELAQNIEYKIDGAVYVDSPVNVDQFRLHLLLQTTTGDVSYTSGWVSAVVGNWVSLSFKPTLTWTGTLNNAFLFVQSSVGLTPFYFDDMTVTESAAKNSTAAIHRVVLSAQSNPFTGVLNSQGIYVINCAGGTIDIRDCRIQGTLILLQPGSNSTVAGSVCWEPHIAFSVNPSIPNLPALICDAKFELAMTNTPLNEALTNKNYNPVGIPYQDSEDADKVDTYPSQITGIVLNKLKLVITERTTILGSVVCTDSIEFKGPAVNTAMRLIHHPLYLLRNPPIGFRGTPSVQLVPGSIEQLVQ